MRVRWMAVFPVSYQVNLFLRRVLTFGTCHSPCHFRVGLNSSSPDFSTVSPSRMWPLAKFMALTTRVAVLLSHCFLSTDGERNHVCGAKCAASGTFRFVQWPSVWKHRKGAYSLAPVGKAQLLSLAKILISAASPRSDAYLCKWDKYVMPGVGVAQPVLAYSMPSEFIAKKKW